MTMERRSFTADMDCRASANGTLRFTGYASTTETPYDVADFTETIARGAFKRTLADGADVVLLIDHTGLPLARTSAGTMKLTEDVRGLRVDARLNPTDPDVARLKPKLQRGDLREMSFAFRPVKQEWNKDRSKRLISEVSLHRGDVSIVAHGANQTTSAVLRSRQRRRATKTPLHRSNVEWAKARRAKLNLRRYP